MLKAGECQLGSSATAAGFRISFVDLDRATSARERERGGQPVGAGADDDGVESGHAWHGSGSAVAGRWCWPARRGVLAPLRTNVPAWWRSRAPVEKWGQWCTRGAARGEHGGIAAGVVPLRCHLRSALA